MLRIIFLHKYFFLIAFTFSTVALLLFFPPFPQDISYHNFADKRFFLGINNFVNVVSNISFIAVGCIGLLVIFIKNKANFITSEERLPYMLLFGGTILTGVGSSYYHLAPDNSTLFWDRLPMCIISTSYFSAIFMERVNKKFGLVLLFPLVITGLLGALFWEVSEMAGRGDLRFYSWVQFYPISMILLMLLLCPSPYTGTHYIVESLVWYALAKLGEFFDSGIYVLTLQNVSGHTIKHFAAALGIYSIIRYLKHRSTMNKL